MSNIRAFELPQNEYSRQQYTQYLQDQLQRISSFMIFQKKQNQKNNHLIQMIQDQNDKIKFLNDKIQLLQIYHHQNFKHHQKVFNSVQKVQNLQKKLQKLQFSLSQQKYHHSNHKYMSKKQISKEIKEMIDSQTTLKFEQLKNKINSIQRLLLGKINLILQDKQRQDNRTKQNQKKQNIKISKNHTPSLPTKYSDNNTTNTRQFQNSEINSKNQVNYRQKRVSSFVNQRLDRIQRQINNLQNSKDNRSINNLTQRSLKQKKQTSPISSYLRQQNQFQSQQQNIDFNKELTSKSFYSVMQNQNLPNKKNKKKQRRSKSKSSIISSRSQSKTSKNIKSKNNLKEQKQIPQFKKKEDNDFYQYKKSNQENISQKLNTKSIKKSVKIIKKDENLTDKTKDSKISLQKKNSKRKSQIEKNNLKIKNNKRKSSISQLSLSQNSIKSKSRSKSIDKNFKNQKEYLMYCDKFHS